MFNWSQTICQRLVPRSVATTALQMRQEISLSLRGPAAGSQELARDDITTQDERARAMAHILEFPSLDFARSMSFQSMISLSCIPIVCVSHHSLQAGKVNRSQ